MSHPYDPSTNPQSQPSANPYEQPAQSYPPAGEYPPAQQGQFASAQQGQYAPAQQGQYAPQPYGQPYGVAGGEHPQGTMVFVLGIVGIFVGVCAPIAWILGNNALKEIKATGASYSNESQIRTGRMLGKVFTILYIVFIVLYIIAIIVFLAIGAGQGIN